MNVCVTLVVSVMVALAVYVVVKIWALEQKVASLRRSQVPLPMPLGADGVDPLMTATMQNEAAMLAELHAACPVHVGPPRYQAEDASPQLEVAEPDVVSTDDPTDDEHDAHAVVVVEAERSSPSPARETTETANRVVEHAEVVIAVEAEADVKPRRRIKAKQ